MDPAVDGEYGQNSFWWACYHGNIEFIEYLAEKYSELINIVEESYKNGLFVAIERNKKETVKFLIDELGMDPAVKGYHERNSFLYACCYGHIEIVKYLAGKYPNLINSVDEYNNTCLHLATEFGHNDGLHLAVWQDTTYTIHLSFLRACGHGKLSVVKYLAERYEHLINTIDENNNNCLHLAAEFGDMDTVVFLIEELGMDPATNGLLGRNSFLIACGYGKIVVIKYLAKRYEHLKNTVDEDNNNGLHLAAEFGDMDTVVFLIEELGMDPAVEGKNGKNVFVQGKVSGNINIFRYLWFKRLLGAPKTWFNSMLLEQLEYEYE